MNILRKYFLRKGLVAPFLLMAFVLIMESGLTGILPWSRGLFFDGLESKSAAIYTILAIYFANYVALDFFQAIKEWAFTKVVLWWRTDRTERVAKIADKSTATTRAQRVQQAIYDSYMYRIKVWCEFFISGTIILYLAAANFDEPLLVLAALGYAGISVYIAVLFNPRLKKAERVRLEAEATFRESLMEKLSNISLLGVTNNTVRRLVAVRAQYLLFTRAQNGIMNILPYVVLIPTYFAGHISLGDMVRHQASFALIVINAAILITVYPLLIKGVAQESRVQDIEDTVE